MRLLPVALAALALSGCLSPGGPAPAAGSGAAPPFAFDRVVDVRMPCTGCFEPAAAVDAHGRIFTAAHRHGGVGVSTDGGRTFAVKPVPPPSSPSPRAAGASDDVVQVAPWGSVYYTELWSDGGGVALAGVHVAASDDAGDSWPVNVFVQARQMPASLAVTSDRQWLAFDGDATVYLVWNCGASALICALRSDDRGATWGAAVPVVASGDHSFPSPAGFPSVGPDGTLLVPYFSDPRPDLDAATQGDVPLGARSIRVAASTDGGRTFRQSTAYTAPLGEGTSGGGWPEATILRDGTWVASWSDPSGTMWVSLSQDEGATWTPAPLGQAGTAGPVHGHPFLRPRAAGGFDAVWFGAGNVTAGRFAGDGRLLAVAVAPAPGGGHSDYPFFDHAPDGRIVAPFITPDGNGLRLAVSTPDPPAP